MKKIPLLIAFFATALSGLCCPNSSPVFLILRPSESADDYRADEMLTEIMNVIGLSPNFELKEAKVDNIEASISHRKRYILYNPSFINWINDVTKDKWAAMALLAHEVGHHLNGHTIRKTGSTPILELEADEFAGFVLYKLGATLPQAQEVMKYIAKPKESATHPGRLSRMQAIENGWNKAANAGLSSTRHK